MSPLPLLLLLVSWSSTIPSRLDHDLCFSPKDRVLEFLKAHPLGMVILLAWFGGVYL